MPRKRTVVYVRPNKPSGWTVNKKGQKKPLSSHRIKAAAIKAGKRFAKRARLGTIKIMGNNGRLQNEYNYG